MKYPALDVEDWKTYKDQGLNVDSLWVIPSNIKDELHKNDFHGQFVAQIPREFIFRFTQPGDIVADPFMGRGTSGIEARRMGRHYMGCELNHATYLDAAVRIKDANEDEDVQASLMHADCLEVEWPEEVINLSFVHPPYLDIIKFSEDIADFSNMPVPDFLAHLGILAENLLRGTVLDGHMVLVIGDTWNGKTSSLFPLAYHCMAVCMEAGWQLRGIVTKNMSENTKGKGGGKDGNLKYYRCLKSKTFRFASESIFVFRKAGR